MQKGNVFLIIALTAVLLAGLTFGPAQSASAQGESPVGVVVAYVPGQSITIADKTGAQHEYMISSDVKILPPGRGNSLTVGSFVTIIAPASLSQGKEIAVGIVVHPAIPGGWAIPTISTTPIASATAVGLETATPIGTMVTDTATPVGTLVTDTATVTTTGTPLVTDTPTETATPMPETPTETPTATPSTGGTATSANTFIDWLASLFREILTRQ